MKATLTEAIKARERSFLDGMVDAAIDYIVENKLPEDVFTEDQLDEWAQRNSYELIKELPV